MLTLIGIALVAYLLGSFPAGYIAGRLAGIDIRKVGSGNVGATNVTRVFGRRLGYSVFVLDLAKGLAAVEAAVIMGKGAQSSAQFVDFCAVIAAFFSVIGHSYSIWLGFTGGKGVATSIGALFGVNWIMALIVCAVWVAVFQTTRYVSIASIAAAVALPIAAGIMLFLKELPTPIPLYFSLCLATIIVVRHRSNLSRLLKGTEPRFARK